MLIIGRSWGFSLPLTKSFRHWSPVNNFAFPNLEFILLNRLDRYQQLQRIISTLWKGWTSCRCTGRDQTCACIVFQLFTALIVNRAGLSALYIPLLRNSIAKYTSCYL